MNVMMWDKSRREYLGLKDVKSIDISHAGKYYLIGKDMFSFENYELDSVTGE